MRQNQPHRSTRRPLTLSSNLIRINRLAVAVLLSLLGLAYAGPLSDVEASSDDPQASSALYLPVVSSGSGLLPELACEQTVEEAAIFAYMQQHPDQGRPNLNCNRILSQVARAHAVDMAERRYFDHVNPDGHGPNYLVREAGFRLPDWYPESRTANNIESIGGGFPTADDVWNAWIGAESHRSHILGTSAFFAEQLEVGVGYHYDPDSEFRTYWVVITAPTETN